MFILPHFLPIAQHWSCTNRAQPFYHRILKPTWRRALDTCVFRTSAVFVESKRKVKTSSGSMPQLQKTLNVLFNSFFICVWADTYRVFMGGKSIIKKCPWNAHQYLAILKRKSGGEMQWYVWRVMLVTIHLLVQGAISSELMNSLSCDLSFVAWSCIYFFKRSLLDSPL